MIAADTSTWIAFLEGSGGADTLLLDQALGDHQLLMVRFAARVSRVAASS